MKLMTTKTMGNMYLFNHKEQLKKYECGRYYYGLFPCKMGGLSD